MYNEISLYFNYIMIMTLLTYTGLVLTLATIHEYVPYTPSLILIMILLRLLG